MRNWTVYKHTGPTSIVYIGITSMRPEQRWSGGHGYSNGQPRFYNAIKKYGWEAFRHEILFENLDEETAKKIERELIAKYKKQKKSYNISDGGDSGACGIRHSPETRAKIAASLRGRKQSAESRAKQSKAIKGRFVGWVHVNKDGQTKTVPPEQLNDYLAEGWVRGSGIVHSEKTRKRMSESAKGRHMTTTAKQKLSAYNSDSRWIHKGDERKKVPSDRIQSHLDCGWQLGSNNHRKMSPEERERRKGRKWMTNGEQDKQVAQDEISIYINSGWQLGRSKYKQS